MQWLDKKRLYSESTVGTFVNLGCPTSVEAVAGTGFDWMVIDLEHGAGSQADLRNMLLACSGSSTAPIVRLRSVDADAAKFAMDSGAAGIMFPFVKDAEMAHRAAAIMKYPPMGCRGVAGAIRATNYGREWRTYFETANQESTVVVQIETPEAVANAEAIAAVPGVDVLFVGPLDLSANLGHPGDFGHPKLTGALEAVVSACENHGKPAGILTKSGFEKRHLELGFRFVAAGSDLNAVVDGMSENLASLRSA